MIMADGYDEELVDDSAPAYAGDDSDPYRRRREEEEEAQAAVAVADEQQQPDTGDPAVDQIIEDAPDVGGGDAQEQQDDWLRELAKFTRDQFGIQDQAVALDEEGNEPAGQSEQGEGEEAPPAPAKEDIDNLQTEMEGEEAAPLGGGNAAGIGLSEAGPGAQGDEHEPAGLPKQAEEEAPTGDESGGYAAPGGSALPAAADAIKRYLSREGAEDPEKRKQDEEQVRANNPGMNDNDVRKQTLEEAFKRDPQEGMAKFQGHAAEQEHNRILGAVALAQGNKPATASFFNEAHTFVPDGERAALVPTSQGFDLHTQKDGKTTTTALTDEQVNSLLRTPAGQWDHLIENGGLSKHLEQLTRSAGTPIDRIGGGNAPASAPASAPAVMPQGEVPTPTPTPAPRLGADARTGQPTGEYKTLQGEPTTLARPGQGGPRDATEMTPEQRRDFSDQNLRAFTDTNALNAWRSPAVNAQLQAMRQHLDPQGQKDLKELNEKVLLGKPLTATEQERVNEFAKGAQRLLKMPGGGTDAEAAKSARVAQTNIKDIINNKRKANIELSPAERKAEEDIIAGRMPGGGGNQGSLGQRLGTADAPYDAHKAKAEADDQARKDHAIHQAGQRSETADHNRAQEAAARAANAERARHNQMQEAQAAANARARAQQAAMKQRSSGGGRSGGGGGRQAPQQRRRH